MRQTHALGCIQRILVCALTLILNGVTARAAVPRIPAPAEVVRYERVEPVFRSVRVSKETGDALLAALDGGLQIRERQVDPGPAIVCALPIPPRQVIAVTLTNGSTYKIGISFEGSSAWLPEGLYVVSEAARERVVAYLKRMEDDLRREIRAAVKPCKYRLGTADDGGTLSGVALIAYGDARKWKRIHDANRTVIKNPNSMNGSEMITLPKIE